MASYKTWMDFDAQDDFVLPEGNVLRGQLLFKKHCSQCHTIRRDGVNPYGTLMGPNLYGVMGRTAAQNQRTGGMKHSRALEESGILWTEKNMMNFLKNPRMFAGGVINMNFRGIDSFQDRVDLVHYLKRAGHESWMLRDGTPHQQRAWWARDGGQGATTYHQLHSQEKDVKPYQHLQRAIGRKLSETYQTTVSGLGLDGFMSASASSETEIANSLQGGAAEADIDVQTWRRVQRVEDGVKVASMQQSFNWPPPEVIAEGPLRPSAAAKGAKALKKVAVPPAEASAAPAAAPAPEPGRHASQAFLVCEGAPAPKPEEGVRAPSGIWVFADRGGPAAAAPRPAAATKDRAKKVSAATTSAAPTPGGPAASSPPSTGAPSGRPALPDAGRPAALAPSAPPASVASASKL